jgi:sugar phosphate isomerase/epimerase
VGHSFITESDVCQDLLYWRHHIVHLHIEDIKNKIHQHLLLGQGDINFPQVMETLRQIDFTGDFTLDMFEITDFPEDFAQLSFASAKKYL